MDKAQFGFIFVMLLSIALTLVGLGRKLDRVIQLLEIGNKEARRDRAIL